MSRLDVMCIWYLQQPIKKKKRKEWYSNKHKNTISKLKWNTDTSTRKSKEAWGRINKVTKGEKEHIISKISNLVLNRYVCLMDPTIDFKDMT